MIKFPVDIEQPCTEFINNSSLFFNKFKLHFYFNSLQVIISEKRKSIMNNKNGPNKNLFFRMSQDNKEFETKNARFNLNKEYRW